MKRVVAVLIGLACAGPAFAQTHQQQDDLQPGVNTSAMPPQPATTPEPAAPPAAASAASASKAASSAPATASNAGKARSSTAATKTPAKSGKALDRIDLDTTQITGNKELPKVMYVVPWKRSDLGDLTGKPANSLVDEVLQPVDRDVFNREERYYHTVAPEKSSAAPPAGGPADH